MHKTCRKKQSKHKQNGKHWSIQEYTKQYIHTQPHTWDCKLWCIKIRQQTFYWESVNPRQCSCLYCRKKKRCMKSNTTIFRWPTRNEVQLWLQILLKKHKSEKPVHMRKLSIAMKNCSSSQFTISVHVIHYFFTHHKLKNISFELKLPWGVKSTWILGVMAGKKKSTTLM